MKNIAILTSGDAPCMKTLGETFANGDRFRVVLLATDRENSPALEAAAADGIATAVIPREDWRDRPEEVIGILRDKGAEILVLDRFLPLLDDSFSKAFPGSIIDISKCDGDEAARKIAGYLTDEHAIDRQWADVLGLDFDPAAVARKNEQTPPPEPQPAPQPAFRQPYAQQPPRGYVAPPPVSPYPGMQPQPMANPRGYEPMPPTHLLWAILCTIFCCFIPGIVAIIFSSLVSSRYYAHDFEGSRRASRTAEYWIIASIVLGVISLPVYWFFMMF